MARVRWIAKDTISSVYYSVEVAGGSTLHAELSVPVRVHAMDGHGESALS